MSEKYCIILGDGMADEPLAELSGMTPLEAAHTPNMDYIAREGSMGLLKTVPEGYFSRKRHCKSFCPGI
jgi:Predicted phosphoglycerate mutase, AP superfamily